MAKTDKPRPRRRFTDEFKASAVRLVLDEGKSVGAAARELDLVASALGEWVERARADRSNGTPADDGGARGAYAAAQGAPDSAEGARDLKKSRGVLREAEPVRFAFIAAKKAEHRVTHSLPVYAGDPQRILCLGAPPAIEHARTDRC